MDIASPTAFARTSITIHFITITLGLILGTRRDVLASLQNDVTLGSLPDHVCWQFTTKDLAIMCDAGEPLPLNIYGAMRYASLCGFRTQLPLTLHIRPWSTSDEEQAARMFPAFKRGTSTHRLMIPL